MLGLTTAWPLCSPSECSQHSSSGWFCSSLQQDFSVQFAPCCGKGQVLNLDGEEYSKRERDEVDFLGIDFETRMYEGLTGHVRVHLGLSCL